MKTRKLNRETIVNTAKCRMDEHGIFCVESPEFEMLLGAAETEGRAWEIFFELLETRETMLRLLDASKRGDGVQIFIGAQSHLFGLAGCSVIIAPYQNSREEIVGAIGVIGPTRINYARIIPMVDYTAKVIGRLIG